MKNTQWMDGDASRLSDSLACLASTDSDKPSRGNEKLMAVLLDCHSLSLLLKKDATSTVPPPPSSPNAHLENKAMKRNQIKLFVAHSVCDAALGPEELTRPHAT